MMRRERLTWWVIVSGILGWLAATGSAATGSAVSPDPVGPLQADQETLVMGRPGDVQTYRFTSQAPWIDLCLEKQGGVVSLRLLSAKGEELLWAQSPGSRFGPESIIWRAAEDSATRMAASSYVVEIHFQTAGQHRLTLRTFDRPSREQRRRLGARRLSAIASDAFREGSKTSRRRSLALYSKALEAWRRIGDAAQQARCQLARAILYQRFGEQKEAGNALDDALILFRAVGDRHGQATSLNLAGVLARAAGKNTEATAFYRQSRQLHRQMEDACGEARSLLNLGLLAQHGGEPSLARERFSEALEGCPAEQDPLLGAELLVDMAGVHEALAELHAAVSSLQRAIPMLREQGKLSNLAVALGNLGTYQRKLGNYDAAFEAYHQGLDVARQSGDRRRQATLLNSLGYAYLRLGEPQRALVFLLESLPLRRHAKQRRGEAVTLSNLGRAFAELGKNAAARGHYGQSLALRREIGDRRGESMTLIRLAKNELAVGEEEEATRLLRQARSISQQIEDRRGEAQATTLLASALLSREAEATPQLLAEVHEARHVLADMGDREFEARALKVAASLHRRFGDLTKAQDCLLEAMESLESIRTEINDPDLRSSFLAEQRQIYELAIEVALEQHREAPDGGWQRQALALDERFRARSLLDLVAHPRPRGVDGIPAELTSQRRLLQAESRDSRRRLNDPATANRRALQERLEHSLSNLERVDAELRQLDESDGLTATPVLTVDGMQRQIDPGTLVLQFFLAPGSSHLWTLDAHQVRHYELAERHDLEEQGRALLKAWRRLEMRSNGEQPRLERRLSNALLGPLSANLGGYERLVFVMDGVLHYLPMAALPLPSSGPTPEPLVAHYEVVQIPSLSVLASLRQRREQGSRKEEGHPAQLPRITVVADPVFSLDDPRMEEAIRSPIEDSHPSARLRDEESDRENLPRLPGSGEEAQAIARLAPNSSQLLLGLDASRQAVLAGALQHADIVHFATHGQVDDRSPRLSGLTLARFDEHRQELDGHLSLDDIYSLDLQANLIVLSGCQTALGKAIDGEGLLSLTRGFMHAGAARVVATLWSVQDRASQELMRRYYHHLLVKDQAPAAALRLAQNELRRTARWRDPYFWAAFVHQGEWRK